MIDVANKLGLGELDLSKIEIDGEFAVIPNFALPIGYVAPREAPQVMSFEESYANWHKIGTVRPQLDEEKCIQCGECEDICPRRRHVSRSPADGGPGQVHLLLLLRRRMPEGALTVPESASLYERFFTG